MTRTRDRHANVIKAVFDRPWALMPSMLSTIASIIDERNAGVRLSDDEIVARIDAAATGPRNGSQRAGAVAVIPIYGVISQRMNLMSRMSGGTSIDDIRGQFRDAMADRDITGIVFDVDSPGGAVDGVEELATEIREARGGDKRIVSVANTLSASAAYWLAAQADEVVATPSAQVGSVGIFAMHQDVSKAAEMAGVSTSFVSAGKYKVEGNEFEPLSDDAREYLQGQVDEVYDMFVGSLAKARGVSVGTVRSDFGEGRVMLAKRAKSAGMIDRIDTLDNTVRRVAWAAPRTTTQAIGSGMTIVANAEPPTPLPDAPDVDVPDDVDVPVSTDPTPLEAPSGPSGDVDVDPPAIESDVDTASTFTDRLSAMADDLSNIAAHAAERARLRAKEGRPAFGDDNRDRIVAIAESLGAIRSTLLATVEPAQDDQPPVADNTAWRRKASLSVAEAAARGGYRLPTH